MISDVKVNDPKLLRAFKNTGEPLAVCGPDGRVLGYFSPAKPSYRHIPIPISDEELRRLANTKTGEWFSAAEVEAKMKEWKKCSE